MNTSQYYRQRAMTMRERAREMMFSSQNKELNEAMRYHFAVLVTDFYCLAHQYDEMAKSKERK